MKRIVTDYTHAYLEEILKAIKKNALPLRTPDGNQIPETYPFGV